MARTDSTGKGIKAGDRVIVVGDNVGYGDDPALKFFWKTQYSGVVTSDETHEKYYCSGLATMVCFNMRDMFKGYGDGNLQVRADHLRVLSADEYEMNDKNVEVALNIASKHEGEVLSYLTLESSKQNYQTRTFTFDSKRMFDTNNSCIKIGHWNDDDFQVKEHYFQAVCCSLTKVQRDLEIYIPDIWLRYFGWTLYDLVEWLKFLAQCEIGFEYEYRGVTQLPADFIYNTDIDSGILGWTKGDTCSVKPIMGEIQSQIFPNRDGAFHCIRLRGSRECDEYTYLRFICLRYFYNQDYWTIPGHAMQIKNALGEEVTHWQALLMAHLSKCYRAYYALGSQTDLDPKSEYKVLKGFEFQTSNNYDRHLDPFQNVGDVLRRIKNDGGYVNKSFEYVCDTYTRQELDKFFAAKDYIGLYDYVRSKQQITEGSKQWRLVKEKEK